MVGGRSIEVLTKDFPNVQRGDERADSNRTQNVSRIFGALAGD